MTTVTRVTSIIDNLSLADYAEIWAELRQNHSLAQVVEAMQSTLSRGMWGKYEHGQATLSRQMKNDLRRAVGLPPLLAEAIMEAVADNAPDAVVWTDGSKAPDNVILVSGPFSLNGSAQTEMPAMPAQRPQVARKRYIRPCVPLECAERLERLEGVSWHDVIEAGLKVYEVMG